MSTLIPSASADLVRKADRDPLIELLGRIFDDPEIIKSVQEFRRHIVDALLSYGVSLEGLEIDSAGGTFIRTGIEQRLQKARTDLSTISVEMCIGAVELLDDKGHTMIGHLGIPYTSDWARQHFTNKNPIIDGDHFVFTPYRFWETLDPMEVKTDSKGSFILSKQEEIAAQILMVIYTANAYRNLAITAIEEADIMGSHASRVKFDVNKSFLMDALHFALRLREELGVASAGILPGQLVRGISELD